MRATVKVAMDEEQAREQERVPRPNSARVTHEATNHFLLRPLTAGGPVSGLVHADVESK